MLQSNSVFVLKNGVKSPVNIPVIGIGCYRSTPGAETVDAVFHALKVGYRHIDTATRYDNESDVGEAIRRSGLPREEIFVTTKLWNSDQGYDNTLKAIDASLEKLGLAYVDLYLVHSPDKPRLETWRAMEKILADGKARAIGVSNYNIHHLKELLEHSTVKPAVNQIELHPYLHRDELVQFCQEHGILIEAYSPLTKGVKLNDPPLRDIAHAHKKSTAQVLIRYCLEKGWVVLPKSVKPERIEENLHVFDFSLTKEEMQRLDSLDEHLVTGWDPLEWS